MHADNSLTRLSVFIQIKEKMAKLFLIHILKYISFHQGNYFLLWDLVLEIKSLYSL